MNWIDFDSRNELKTPTKEIASIFASEQSRTPSEMDEIIHFNLLTPFQLLCNSNTTNPVSGWSAYYSRPSKSLSLTPNYCTSVKYPPFMFWTNKCSQTCDRTQWALKICFNLYTISVTADKHVFYALWCEHSILYVTMMIFCLRHLMDGQRWSIFNIFIGRLKCWNFVRYIPRRFSHTESHQRAYIEKWVFIGAINREAAVDRTITIVIIITIQYNRCVCEESVFCIDWCKSCAVKWCGNRPTECWTFKYFIHLFLVSTSVTAYWKRNEFYTWVVCP